MDSRNSLVQYVKLYEDNKALFQKGYPDWLVELKNCALAALKTSAFKPLGAEGFEKTSMNDMFEPDLGVNIGAKDLIDRNCISTCGVETLNCIRVNIHNDIVASVVLPHGMSALPKGLHIQFVDPRTDGVDKEVKEYLERIATDPNPEVLLNFLYSNGLLYIKVDNGVHIDTPVQIINYTGGEIPMICNREVLINLGVDAKCDILSCDHTSLTASNSHIMLVNTQLTVEMGEHSMMNFIDMEESDMLNRRVQNVAIVQGRESEINITGVTLINGITRNNWVVDAVGEHTQCRLNGLIIGKENSHIDNYTQILHKADYGRSNQLFKYVVGDNARGVFGGIIVVEKEARFNEAYQTNRNVIQSENARMYSKPQLLIYNDDVKCSHGSATGQLDDKARFYMQQRGIPRPEAQTMLIQAFMNDVVEQIHLDNFRERLSHLVERRLKGEDVLCGTCKLRVND